MDCMPPELLVKIFSCLDPIGVANCGQVCHRWRSITVKLTNPLYLPSIISKVMHKLHALGGLQDLLELRLACKLWKDGMDILTQKENLILKGLTTIAARQNISGELTHQWNPFPTRIVRLKLCFGHDDPDNAKQQLENEEGNMVMERFGMHVRFLQIQLQHADCAEKHHIKILNNLLKTLQGLIVSECVSPHRFVKRKGENSANSVEASSISNDYELGQLENLKFLKLDDSDSILKYSNLYKRIIENAPNLQHLEINGYHSLDMGIIKLLANRLSCKMSLTHLKMDAESSDVPEILEILVKSDFLLKYLSLKINGFGNAEMCARCTTLLHSSLEKFGQTLERLELKLSWFEEAENPKPSLLHVFPSSKSLTKLDRFKLVGYRGQLDFLTDLVKLTSLMIVDYKPESQNVFKSDQSFHENLPKLKELYLPLQGTLYSDDFAFKNKLQNFMYEEDESFVPKYCGLYQEIFP